MAALDRITEAEYVSIINNLTNRLANETNQNTVQVAKLTRMVSRFGAHNALLEDRINKLESQQRTHLAAPDYTAHRSVIIT